MRNRSPAYRTIMGCMAWAAVSAAVGALALLPSLMNAAPVGQLAWSMIGLSWLVALILLGRAWHAAYRLGFGVERLRGAVSNLVADRNRPLPPVERRETPEEILALHDAFGQFAGQVAQERHGPDRRLTAVLASLQSGVLVVTEQGQVSLVNFAGRMLLGAERVRVGTSVFAALERRSVLDAIARSRSAGGPVEASFLRLDGVELHGRVNALPDDDGAFLLFPAVELDRHRPEVDFDLGLHDAPPPTLPITPDLPLDEIPALVLDLETTGLDVSTDRIVSLGGIRAHGARLYPGHIVDSLVAPGIPIPRASTAVHGISDATVADARGFADVYPDYLQLARGAVIVGHNIPFDLTVLRNEARRSGWSWEDPVFLDTFRLSFVLHPDLRGRELENLASLYEVDVRGRHTALGDALVTADVWIRMLPRLKQLGIDTLGELVRRHHAEAPDVVRMQRERGWIWSQPAPFERPGREG